MNKSLFIIAVLLFSAMLMNGQTETAKTEKNENLTSTSKVEVYYFHNTRRCETCKAVESVTLSALEENYPEQMKSGEITFQSLNIEEDANEPLVRKLHVSGQTLLFVKDGKKKDLTNEAFMYARSNPEKLKEKIVNTIEKL